VAIIANSRQMPSHAVWKHISAGAPRPKASSACPTGGNSRPRRYDPMPKLTKPLNVALLGRSDASARTADFLTVTDWAIRPQVSKRTVFRMIDEGIIPPCDFSAGKIRRWHYSTYERWTASQTGGE
jgi:hypothetical protein